MVYKLSKVSAHVICWLPLIYLIFAAIHRTLGADPQEIMLHLLGFWALVFLLLSLSVTPLRRVFQFPILVNFRRMLGLYAGWYMLLHVALFFTFYLNLDISELVNEVIERPYITVGMLALLLMLPLVVTSTKAMQRRLGKKWKALHRLAYLIGALSIVHFVWQSKSDLNEPLLYAVWLVVVLVSRRSIK
ncbi:MAG: sulfoxide reductase heme-binding subunit YedZ [Kangiellaceae bacterium]|nr:sulfoxide reductase heme-binding subunit YedZ [Kangiellaceae bacterium]